MSGTQRQEGSRRETTLTGEQLREQLQERVERCHPRTGFRVQITESAPASAYPTKGWIEILWEDGPTEAEIRTSISDILEAAESAGERAGMSTHPLWGVHWPTHQHRELSESMRLALLVSAEGSGNQLSLELIQELIAEAGAESAEQLGALEAAAYLQHAKAQNPHNSEALSELAWWRLGEHINCENIEIEVRAQARLALELSHNLDYPYLSALRMMIDPHSALRAALIART